MRNPPEIVDSHCHLDFPDFDGDRGEVLERAAAAGVARMLTICTEVSNSAATIEIAERYENVFFALGTHPHKAHAEPRFTIEDIVANAAHPKMVAVGETGLDFHYTSKTVAEQRISIVEHIEAARQTSLPIIFHARNADDEIAGILAAEMKNGPFTGVMHCYSSGPDLARLAVDLGLYLSMSGVVTFRSAQPLRDIFSEVPMERVLVETDSPYLAPPPHRGKRNEPSYVALTAQIGAEIFGVDYASFARQTTENFDCLFPKCKAFSEAA